MGMHGVLDVSSIVAAMQDDFQLAQERQAQNTKP